MVPASSPSTGKSWHAGSRDGGSLTSLFHPRKKKVATLVSFKLLRRSKHCILLFDNHHSSQRKEQCSFAQTSATPRNAPFQRAETWRGGQKLERTGSYVRQSSPKRCRDTSHPATSCRKKSRPPAAFRCLHQLFQETARPTFRPLPPRIHRLPCRGTIFIVLHKGLRFPSVHLPLDCAPAHRILPERKFLSSLSGSSTTAWTAVCDGWGEGAAREESTEPQERRPQQVALHWWMKTTLYA